MSSLAHFTNSDFSLRFVPNSVCKKLFLLTRTFRTVYFSMYIRRWTLSLSQLIHYITAFAVCQVFFWIFLKTFFFSSREANAPFFRALRFIAYFFSSLYSFLDSPFSCDSLTIISCLFDFVKSFFRFFSKSFFVFSGASRLSRPLPLGNDLYILPHFLRFVNTFFLFFSYL